MYRKNIVITVLIISILLPSQLFSNDKSEYEKIAQSDFFQIEGTCKRISIDSDSNENEIENKVVIENSQASLTSTIQSCDNMREEWSNILLKDSNDKLKAKKLLRMRYVGRIDSIDKFIPLRCSVIRNEGQDNQLGIMIHEAQITNSKMKIKFLHLFQINKKGEITKIFPPFDSYGRIRLQHICDINEDNIADIILYEEAEGCNYYTVIQFSRDFSHMTEEKFLSKCYSL